MVDRVRLTVPCMSGAHKLQQHHDKLWYCPHEHCLVAFKDVVKLTNHLGTCPHPCHPDPVEDEAAPAAAPAAHVPGPAPAAPAPAPIPDPVDAAPAPPPSAPAISPLVPRAVSLAILGYIAVFLAVLAICAYLVVSDFFTGQKNAFSGEFTSLSLLHLRTQEK
ncbi:hypothetical protein CF319_g8644 [Tilletia indica]|nr:hypothetical protein CF319_g8644 [Tilletia indica]